MLAGRNKLRSFDMALPENRSSWLRLDNLTNPAPAIAAMWEESKKRLGFVREFLKLPFEPDRLALFQGYVNRLMRGADCLLTGQERELIALVVSLENRCEACVITHAGALEAHGMAKRTVDVLLSNWRRAEVSPRMRAMCEFASDLTLKPQLQDETNLDRLRAAGLNELEILEAVQIVAIFNATNRLNSGLGTRIDDGAHKAMRKA
jgi:uncharacterized peroxidase-related enzyme